MMTSVVAVIASDGQGSARAVAEQLKREPLLSQVAVAAPADEVPAAGGIERLQARSLRAGADVCEALRWFESTSASHLLWILSPRAELSRQGLQRLVAVARDSRAAMLYSDYFDLDADGVAALHPLIDYQPGSLRDDFDFGQVVLFSRESISGLAGQIERDQFSDAFGGFYDLRLRASERGSIVHLPEPTYSLRSVDQRTVGEAHFSYVDPRNRDYQIEMERLATAHLKRIGAWLSPPNNRLAPDEHEFPVEASVVIPVRNRARTVADAIGSVFSQTCNFPFNLIVVDNHSTDGTTQTVAELASKEPRLVHLVPTRRDLGIGGCWNEAIYSDACGRYAVQLDSDDLYSSSDVLQRIVDHFRDGNYAAVIGSYTIVDFDLKTIPPGLIDHREWTDDNGHNNALRIAGLGAPRAFHVPTLRTLGFPNVSFGEDYAVALRLSREYRIGRIYDSLYWCRRWEGNTDHQLPLETKNRYALYKDRLRSLEISARQQLNS